MLNHIQTGLRYEWLQLFAAQNGFTIEEAEQFLSYTGYVKYPLICKYSTGYENHTLKKKKKFAYGEGGNILFVGRSVAKFQLDGSFVD